MKQALIFLNGTYPTTHLSFYRREIENAQGRALIIAVDGALALFAELGLTPDLILGDFDSVAPGILRKYPDLLRIEYPTDKDATDGELALNYALDQNCDRLEIYGALDTNFESDQMLANVFLLALVNDRERSAGHPIYARLIDHCQEIHFLEDSNMTLTGEAGDLLSLIPVSRQIKVTLRGTKWELTDNVATFGSTRTLRNTFAQERVTVNVTGAAVVVYRRAGL